MVTDSLEVQQQALDDFSGVSFGRKTAPLWGQNLRTTTLDVTVARVKTQ